MCLAIKNLIFDNIDNQKFHISGNSLGDLAIPCKIYSIGTGLVLVLPAVWLIVVLHTIQSNPDLWRI